MSYAITIIIITQLYLRKCLTNMFAKIVFSVLTSTVMCGKQCLMFLDVVCQNPTFLFVKQNNTNFKLYLFCFILNKQVWKMFARWGEVLQFSFFKLPEDNMCRRSRTFKETEH